MTKGRGEHLERSEIKTHIIEFILNKNEAIKEADIRKWLKDNYEIIDQGNINRHVNELMKCGCIEKIPPKKKGGANYWNIKNIKHLEMIKVRFPKIRLNTFERSLIIVLNSNGYDLKTVNGLKLYIRLRLSEDLFNMCLEVGIKTLYNRARKIYLYEKGFGRYQRINDILNMCYETYSKRNSKLEMPKERFLETMDLISSKDIEIYSKELVLNIFEANFPELSKEKLLKILERKFPGVLEQIPEETPLEIKEEDLEMYMYNVIWWMKQQQWDFDISSFDLLLDSCLRHDILTDIDSNEEQEFARKRKENLALYHKAKDHLSVKERNLVLQDLRQASEIIIKYKQPSIFSNCYNNPEEAYQGLVKFYGYSKELDIQIA